MIAAHFDQSDRNVGVLTLDGELTQEHTEELRSVLIKALINANRVVVSCGAATKADLAGLQLFCSAHKTALRLNKRILFDEKGHSAVESAAGQAGYFRCHGCSLDTQKSCLWKEDCA
jgi:ABC-type transporter Mla MlaB component